MGRWNDFSRISPADLAYVLSCLAVAGRTTAAEVRRLARERHARIDAIERDLAVLRTAGAERKPRTPKAGAARRLQGRYHVADSARALSRREFQLMRLLGSGKRLGECALEMGISDSSASTYQARIRAKLALDNTSAIVRYAVEHDIVE
jgi:DNA-binding CsgD family transcriptional regulator